MSRPTTVTTFLLFVLIAAWLVVAPDARQRPDPPPYRILVTNDDGVQAPGLAAVAQILQAIGTVSIVAPAEQQSSSGHGLVTRDPIYRQDLTLPNGMRAIGLTATPASVVRVAMRMIMQPRPDLVVSGINRGYNLGYSGYVSGTLAAARDATMFGVPAVAASMPDEATASDYIAAAEEVLGVARRVKQFGLAPGTFLNVNIPLAPAGGFKGYRIVVAGVDGGRRRELRRDEGPVGADDVLERVQGWRRRSRRHGHVGGDAGLRGGDADAAGRDLPGPGGTAAQGVRVG